MNIKNPQAELLVTATSIGDLKTTVVGYYHFDHETDKHYIALAVSLKRVEIDAESLKMINL